MDLSLLPRQDVEFLMGLMQCEMSDAVYVNLERRVRVPDAYPLKGSARVTREIHSTLLFRIAEDIIDRAGVRQSAERTPHE